MAKKYLTSIDLSQNQLLNGVVHNTPEDSITSPAAGQVIFNTKVVDGEAVNKFEVYDGTKWVTMGDGAVKSLTAQTTETSSGLSLVVEDPAGTTKTDGTITDKGVITIGHSNVITASSETNPEVYPIKYDSNGHITVAGNKIEFMTAPTSTNKVATKTEIDALVGGVRYIGTVGTGAGAVSADLPTTDTRVGDMYKANSNGDFGPGSPKAFRNCRVGDTFIAVSVEDPDPETHKGDNPTWSYIPSGNDLTEIVVDPTKGTTTTSGATSITTTDTIILSDSGVLATGSEDTPIVRQGLTIDRYGRITNAVDKDYVVELANATGEDDLVITSSKTAEDDVKYTIKHKAQTNVEKTTAGVYAISIDKNGHITSVSESASTILKKYTKVITGDGTTTQFSLTDTDTDFGTKHRVVQIYEDSTGEEVMTDVINNVSNVLVKFNVAPANGKKYNVEIVC